MSAFAESLKPARETASNASVETTVATNAVETPPAEGAETGKPETPPTGEAKPKTPESGVFKALAAERKKRQEAEAQAHYYRGLAEATRGTQKPEDKGPTDEELDNEILLTPHKGVMSRAKKAAEEAVFEVRANMSHELMLEMKPDYQEKLQAFLELADKHPELREAAVREAAPAIAIYRFMVAREKQAAGGKDEATIRKELRAEIEAEVRKGLALKEAGDTPPTPAGKPGTGGAPAPAGDVPDIADLFKKRRAGNR